jgi:hypothetical protein
MARFRGGVYWMGLSRVAWRHRRKGGPWGCKTLRKFDRSFKEAVRLVLQTGKPIAEIAQDLTSGSLAQAHVVSRLVTTVFTIVWDSPGAPRFSASQLVEVAAILRDHSIGIWTFIDHLARPFTLGGV